LNTYRSSTTKGPQTAVLEHRRPSYSMNGRSLRSEWTVTFVITSLRHCVA